MVDDRRNRARHGAAQPSAQRVPSISSKTTSEALLGTARELIIEHHATLPALRHIRRRTDRFAPMAPEYQKIAEVMSVATRAGLAKIALVTEPAAVR